MATDLEIIRIIEGVIAQKLNRYEGNLFLTGDAQFAYLLDENEKVIGLNLYGSTLFDISFLRELPNLTGLVLSNNQIYDISALINLPNLVQLVLLCQLTLKLLNCT